MLHIRGTVSSGKGEGAEYIRLPWVQKQIISKLGFAPYAGTLNVKLNKNDALRFKKALEEAEVVEISPRAGFYGGRCLKAGLMRTVECAVLIPEVPCYPEDVLEVVASMNLRERLHLADGDLLDITVFLLKSSFLGQF